jgi:hypothetical protein
VDGVAAAVTVAVTVAVTAGFEVDSTVAAFTAGFGEDSMAAFTVISMAAAATDIMATHGGSIRLTDIGRDMATVRVTVTATESPGTARQISRRPASPAHADGT